MSQHKSGFLSSVNGRSNTALYYQCKGCSSFLASTLKWDQHLSKCFLKSVNAGGVTPRPVGFRMVTFTAPSLCLERVKPLTGPLSKGKIDEITSTAPVISKRGRPRKLVKIKGPNRRGRPRKIKSPENLTFETSNKSGKISCPKKQGKPRNDDRIVAFDAFEPIGEVDTIDDTLTPEEEDDGGLTRKSKRRRKKRILLDMHDSDSDDDDETTLKKPGKSPKKKKASSAFFKAARKRTRTTDEDKEVKSYPFSCHLCPGKFDSKKITDKHIKSVHQGTRRLMDCAVCERAFNKRDSLNQHYNAHEAAEAKEEAFNLFEPWDEETIKKVRSYRTDQNFFNRQQFCKVCLLKHFTHYSFKQHFIQEHSDPPEAFTLTCKFDKCPLQFQSIRKYLEHAKEAHRYQFFGGLTLTRMERGIYIGNRIVPRDKDGNLLHKQRVLFPKNPWGPRGRKKESGPRKRSGKRPSSFTPSKRLEDEGSDWEEEAGISATQLEKSEENCGANENFPREKIIEIERVHLNDNGTSIIVKHEPCISPTKVKSEKAEEFITPAVEMITGDSLETGDNTASVPVICGIVKGEPSHF